MNRRDAETRRRASLRKCWRRLQELTLAEVWGACNLVLNTWGVALAYVVGSVVGPLLAQDDEIYWLENYSEAIREAKRTQKPIFLEFRCEP
jgi:hypothetical protein